MRPIPDFIRPESRRNEVVRFVEGGLKDLSISRTSFDWGVPVPGSDNHVMYVWLDALTNYITGLGYPDDTELWRRYWPANVHLIGKDVVRFHAVYWPAFLMSAGIALPKQVYGHGFLLSRGEKMSKSVGNVVDPMVLAERFGVDALRYFLLREVTFGQDGSYSAEAIVNRANAELANSFGNLAQRVLVDDRQESGRRSSEIQGHAKTTLRCSTWSATTIGKDDAGSLRRLRLLASASRAGSRPCSPATPISTSRRPGRLRKTDPERMETVLGTLYICIAVCVGSPRPQRDLLRDASPRASADETRQLWYRRRRGRKFRLAQPTPLIPAARAAGGREEAAA